MNVFDFAIKMEEDGRRLYEKLAQEADEPELRAIFTLLAEEERKHREVFTAMKNGEDPMMADSAVLDNARSAFQKLLEKDPADILSNDPDGYHHSIEAEEAYINTYEEMARKEKNAHAARLLLQIAEEEKAHLRIMENIFDFVESPRSFLVSGEFANLAEY